MIIISAIIGILSAILIFWSIDKFNYWRKQKEEFHLFQQQIQPGTILFREYKPENPFLKPTRTKYKILNVREGWCEYVLLGLLNFRMYKEHIRYDTIKHLYELGYKIEEI